MLGVEYEQATKFKLSSRKSTYRLGEIISLDFALLNVSTQRLFVHKLNEYVIEIQVKDEKGEEIAVLPHVVSMEGITNQSYYLVANETAVGSLGLLVGCQTSGYAKFTDATAQLAKDVSQGREAYGKGTFERDLFVNWGYACLRISRPGAYTITARLSNDHVVVSPCEGRIKTAVGTIATAPFTIGITE